MQNSNFEIVKYSDKHRNQLLDVWEKSVMATHGFLKQDDFLSIKELVKTIDFNAFNVFCLAHGKELIGFISVIGQKVEMLFLSPNYIGKGLGKKLMDFAVHKLKATLVDVNEQNTMAVKFYEKLGFKVYERTDRDDQGKDYPLLRMKLNTKDKKGRETPVQ